MFQRLILAINQVFWSILLLFLDALDTVGLRTYGGGSMVLNQKVAFGVLNVPMGVGDDWFRTNYLVLKIPI